MARYKPYSSAQGKFIPIQFASQILAGTFEYTRNYLVDHKLDLSVFDERFRNDESNVPAHDPKVPLKIILFAYSRRIVSNLKVDAQRKLFCIVQYLKKVHRYGSGFA